MNTKYGIGDILLVQIGEYTAYLLIEDVDQYSYYYTNMSVSDTHTETIWYIDNHKAISKVA